MAFCDRCYHVLVVLKWPMALLSLMLIMPGVAALPAVFDGPVLWDQVMFAVIPCLIVFVLWFSVFPELGNSFLNTFEHELTHLIFGLLTGNRPADLDVDQGAGAFSFKGRGNWLMTIAPYFFPTFPVFVIWAGGIYHWIGEALPTVYWSVFGTTAGMYFASTAGEIRTNQTDLKRVGFLFSFCFLPGMHVLSIGLMLSYAAYGWAGFDFYFDILADKMIQFGELLK